MCCYVYERILCGGGWFGWLSYSHTADDEKILEFIPSSFLSLERAGCRGEKHFDNFRWILNQLHYKAREGISGKSENKILIIFVLWKVAFCGSSRKAQAGYSWAMRKAAKQN